MKKSILTLSLLACLPAFADNTPQLQQLQQQINTLNQKVAALEQTNSTTSNPLQNWVGLDTAAPFGSLSKNQLPEMLLKNQSLYPSMLTLGGQVQVDTQAWGGTYQKPNTAYANGDGSGISLSHGYLFTLANLNSWTKTFTSFSATGTQPLSMDRAFILLGDLEKSPFYATAGYTYLPFGVFSDNGSLNNALTTTLFRVSPTNQVSANYLDHGVLVNAAAFQNTSFHNQLADFMINANYTYAFTTQLNASLGAGYINDIRGTNSGVGSSFSNGSTGSTAPFVNNHTLGLYDLNAALNVGPFGLLSELDSTTGSAQTATGNVGVLRAYELAGSYAFKLYRNPAKFTLSYSGTTNMADVNMPLFGDYQDKLKGPGMKSEWLANLQYEAVRNLYVGPEFEYGKLYDQTHTWATTFDLTGYF